MAGTVVHLRFCESTRREGQWVAECGHYTIPAYATDDVTRVSCRGCKRTRAWKRLEAEAALVGAEGPAGGCGVTPRLTRAREAGGNGATIQETISQALVHPSVPRVFTHTGCGGWVLFSLQGGRCLECGAGPLRPGEYAKPGLSLSPEGSRR